MRIGVCLAIALSTAVLDAAPAASSVTLAASADPSTVNQAVHLTATVTPSTSTGEVTFFDGSSPIGSAQLLKGSATFTTFTLGAGVHWLHAYYRGDLQTAASSSATVRQTVSGLGEHGLEKQVSLSGVTNPFGFGTGDFNGDGNVDLAVGNGGGNTITVMLGKGDGTFGTSANYPAASASASSPSATVVGDFDADGNLDIATVNGATAVSTVAVLLGKGDGTFQTAASYPVPGNPHSLSLCDFNGDGIGDLLTDNFLNSSVSILLGNTDGTFQAAANIPAGDSPIHTTCGDFNEDGLADIAIVNFGADRVAVLLGKGNAAFEAPVTYAAGKSASYVSLGDLNRDGHLDLVVVNAADNTVSVFLGRGDGTFHPATAYATGKNPYGVIVTDLNGDGLPDLVVSNTGDNTISVLSGNGDGTFQAQTSYAAGNGPRPLIAADFNRDGRTDLIVGNYFGSTLGVFLGMAADQPQISAVVNGASFESTPLTPGLIFTIGGTGLGPVSGQTEQLDANGRIASKLAGVEVTVDGTPAPLLYVGQNQINAVAPYELANRAGQNVDVRVTFNQTPGNILQVPVAATSPAIFSLGNGQGAIRNQDQSVNGVSNPAAVGSFVSIYATGEGQLKPAGVDGELVTNATTFPVGAVSLTIGGVAVTPQFAGATEFDGFFQVNAKVPAGISGVVPVILKVGSQPSPAGIAMAVK
ncbi:MAG TPA: FG-GAP-like repeat-containing protein [Bryobacteraceae bacterium]|nr:FG-GAP-like repeat-containing protein [Bryobacteraceae bacterium]